MNNWTITVSRDGKFAFEITRLAATDRQAAQTFARDLQVRFPACAGWCVDLLEWTPRVARELHYAD